MISICQIKLIGYTHWLTVRFEINRNFVVSENRTKRRNFVKFSEGFVRFLFFFCWRFLNFIWPIPIRFLFFPNLEKKETVKRNRKNGHMKFRNRKKKPYKFGVKFHKIPPFCTVWAYGFLTKKRNRTMSQWDYMPLRSFEANSRPFSIHTSKISKNEAEFGGISSEKMNVPWHDTKLGPQIKPPRLFHTFRGRALKKTLASDLF